MMTHEIEADIFVDAIRAIPAVSYSHEDTTLVELTAELVSAYVAHNHVAAGDLPTLIATVYATLSNLGRPAVAAATSVDLVPAVPIKKSVTDDYIVSLETGERFRTLKRHIGTLGMTPAQYRAKWGLPHDYPMVCPSYSQRRSEMARGMGLGRKRAAEMREAAE